jgi:16S rRNA (adenine1518-N6/adenine1519-N6)-dimethyltransferase
MHLDLKIVDKYKIIYLIYNSMAIAKKRFGQHFLVDKNIIEKEIRISGIDNNSVVLEIGPGLGYLTKELAKIAKKVYAVEIDFDKMDRLENELIEFDNVEIIQGDILKIDLPDFDVCVSNIPYNISSGIIERLAEVKKGGVLITQKEFAVRMSAKPGDKDYSRLSVFSQYHYNVKIISDVNPRCFRPIPKVMSAMIKIEPKGNKYDDYKGLFNFIRAIFNHRRKTLASSLKGACRDLSMDKNVLKDIANSLVYKDERVYTLSFDKIVECYEDFKHKLNKN